MSTGRTIAVLACAQRWNALATPLMGARNRLLWTENCWMLDG
jgi:hypothetical protein